ncbi:MotA/TolQ/ExbB proton channel family protein [Variovorax paradoxus]|uniref:Biopolymer transport protein ExbB n=1 Tax=Variovorax paradoxus TaxID=34073 RepID=A0A0H2MKY0_VARPD|nr:MotA/TolQ/ExbB proton channel family protein [Variovorax paradoxus]KLN57415.1 biopolymer transport protein ExbB [Variovorax paradoxus]
MSLRSFISSVALTLSIACACFPAAHAQAPEPASASASAIAQKASPAGAKAAAPDRNPYGLDALWNESDYVTKIVLLLLVSMSAGSWYVMVVKLLEQTRMNRQARSVPAVWKSPTIKHGAENLEAGSPFRFVAEAGVEASQKHSGLLEHVDLNDWVAMGITRATDRVNSRIQNGLAFLATVGSTAPFVGLFGTVWGIYHALTAIGIAGQASIDKVAGPVGEALIMTAIGLAVAVPAVLGYNWLVRRNKGVIDEVRAFGNDLHAVILSTKRA